VRVLQACQHALPAPVSQAQHHSTERTRTHLGEKNILDHAHTQHVCFVRHSTCTWSGKSHHCPASQSLSPLRVATWAGTSATRLNMVHAPTFHGPTYSPAPCFSRLCLSPSRWSARLRKHTRTQNDRRPQSQAQSSSAAAPIRRGATCIPDTGNPSRGNGACSASLCPHLSLSFRADTPGAPHRFLGKPKNYRILTIEISVMVFRPGKKLQKVQIVAWDSCRPFISEPDECLCGIRGAWDQGAGDQVPRPADMIEWLVSVSLRVRRGCRATVLSSRMPSVAASGSRPPSAPPSQVIGGLCVIPTAMIMRLHTPYAYPSARALRLPGH
jgi:hypothetical protein